MRDDLICHGKRIDNGEWVEGFYFEQGNGCDAVLGYIKRPSDSIRVDPETVGQFTGSTNKDGKKVFRLGAPI